MSKPPPSPEMAEKVAQALLEEFTSIEAYLEAVHQILAEGHMPDIADLGNRVARLCAGVETIDGDAQKSYAAKLEALLKKLNECEKAMIEFEKSHSKGRSS